jgi:hypothetical protein
MFSKNVNIGGAISLLLLIGCSSADQTSSLPPQKNVVFILSDDHRYDFMGFIGKVRFLKTPNMDQDRCKVRYIILTLFAIFIYAKTIHT